MDRINRFEHNQQFDNLINYLYIEWQKNKNDVDIILRLCSECWFLLSEAGISINDKAFDSVVTKKVLIEVFEYSKKNQLLMDKKCSWFFGYALCLFPFHFFHGNSDDKYINYEKEGIKICYSLLEERESNDIVRYLCNGCLDRININALQKDNINQAYSGGTLIEEYFKEMCLNGITD